MFLSPRDAFSDRKISGLASGVAMLVATLDVFASLPGAVSSLPYASAVSGFSGSLSAGGTTVTWGGGPGWILGLAASAVLLLLGIGTLVRERRKKA